jgi:hypothetical protein
MQDNDARIEIIKFLGIILGEVGILEEDNNVHIIKAFNEDSILRHILISSETFPDSRIQCNYVLIFNHKNSKLEERDIRMYNDVLVDFIIFQSLDDFERFFPSEEVTKDHPLATGYYPHISIFLNSIVELVLGTEVGKEWKDKFILYLKPISCKDVEITRGAIEFYFPYNENKKEAFPKKYIPTLKELENKYPAFFGYEEG